MGEKPFIQYQADSHISKDVAASIDKKLEYLYSYTSQSDTKKKKGKKGKDENEMQLAFREPRGTLVIIDRTFDLITPLIHDYQYQSAVFEYLPIDDEDGKLDRVIKPQKSKKQKQAASENCHVLNEKDQVWERYKNMHIAEVLGGLTEEIKILKQDQEQLRKIGGQEDIHHDDI